MCSQLLSVNASLIRSQKNKVKVIKRLTNRMIKLRAILEHQVYHSW